MAFLLILGLTCPARAVAGDDPYACPTNVEVETGYSVAAQAIPVGQLRALMNKAKMRFASFKKIRATAPPLPPAPALSPAGVAEGLLDMAKEELGSYFASVALNQLCSSRASPYFPNTCAASVGSLQFETDSQFNSLAATIRADVRGLPSCLIKRRTGSPLGYLVYSAYTAVSGAPHAQLADYVHGLAVNSALARSCTQSASASQVIAPLALGSRPLTAACKLYYSIVAIDAMNIVRAESLARTHGPAWETDVDSCKSDYRKCVGLTQQFEQAFIADLYLRQSRSVPTHTDLASDKLTGPWIALLTPYYRSVSWPAGARIAVAAGTISTFLADTRGALHTIRTLRSQLKSDAGGAGQESIQLSIVQESATLARRFASLLVAGSGMLQIADMRAPDAKLRSATARQEAATPTGCQSTMPSSKQQASTDAYCLADTTTQLMHFLSLAVAGYSDYESKNYAAVIEDSIEIARCVPGRACLGDVTGADLPSSNTLRFVAAVASARNAKSFSDVLKEAAAPTDAWKAKSSAPMWWIGSIVGAQIGRERDTGQGRSLSTNEYGMLANIGTGISRPDPWRSHPMGLFFSVIDVGALITATHGNATVNTAANSGWSQTLSPGIFAFYEPFGPIMVGAGYVYRTPALRTVATAQNTLVNLDSSRFMIFVGVDVTFLRLE